MKNALSLFSILSRFASANLRSATIFPSSPVRPGALILLVCLGLSANAQKGEWTWMGGGSTLGGKSGLAGVYGTLGAPAAGNSPGSRYAAANWIDSGGNLWLFGGYGYDANGDSGYLNDLWEFNPSTNEWTWMGGSSTVGSHGGQSGVSGALGVFAAENIPGSRYGAANWTDESGNLWLFGGYAYDAGDPNFRADELNDLWEFNPSTNEWAWIAGDSAIGENYSQPGVYGTLGTPAAGNTPGGRYAPSSWTDGNGNLWLFGGQGYTANGDFYELNDLWEFSPSTNEWAWMNGSSTVGSNGDQPGVYGTLGTPDAGNTPGNRSDASSWTDSNGNLWLFGGNGYDAGGNGGYLNDLWEFSPSTNEWAWMSGSSTVGGNGAQSGAYGTLGTLADGDGPGGRSNATSWTDSNGNLWLFGGYGAGANGEGGYLNDLWEFDPSADEWAWMGGSSTVGVNGGQSGVYGTLGTPAAGNIPGGRNAAISWTDSNGNLWLFGGYGYDANGNYGYLNDLWKYQPSTATLSAATPTFLPAAGSYASAQSVAISDTTPGAAIYYTTNGTTPTLSSAQYTGPIAVSSTETIQAIAAASGYSNSSAATATYTIAIDPPAPAFTISGTAVTVAPGATSGNTSTITITPSGGFTGDVALTAVITSSPSGAQDTPTLNFGSTSPVNIPSASAGTATLTISTTAAAGAALAHSAYPGGGWRVSGGAALACLLLFCIPARRRWRTLFAMGALLVSLAGGVLACGGSFSITAVGDPNPGTTPGAYTITVTGASGATKAAGTVALTVQ